MYSTDQRNAAVEASIAHIIDHGLDDIIKPPYFRAPLELEIIQNEPEEFRRKARAKARRFLSASNLRDEGLGNPEYFLIPKDEHTLRRVAWIDPFDLVKYLSVSILLFPQIEDARINKDALTVHSHRKSGDVGRLFSADSGYNSFRARSGELTRERVGKWKVVTDVANFFDRIGNHPLENSLLNECSCDRDTVRLLREILFQWSGDRRSFGIPVGSDGSRIISEAALISVDNGLSERGVTFVRYVDDYRMFTDTRADAYDAIRLLSELLADEGLNINNRKTQVFEIASEDEIGAPDEQDFNAEHERIDEDHRVQVQKRIRVSGRSTISRYYKHPGRDTLRQLNKLQLSEVLQNVMEETGRPQEDAIRTAVKYFIYVRQDVEILEVLLRTKITTVFYIVDALVKDHERIDPNVKELAKDTVIVEMGNDKVSYPFLLPMLRLCAAPGYEDETLIHSIIDRQSTLDCRQFFREALLLGFQQINRQRIRRLATDVFPTAPAALQRAICFAVKEYSRMSDDEKRPLLRNIQQTSQDWFVRQL